MESNLPEILGSCGMVFGFLLGGHHLSKCKPEEGVDWFAMFVILALVGVVSGAFLGFLLGY
tara:strand:- start:2006 stop:2188 length:183 start_codon:yes stop_codon:yes gene_type:complete